MLNIYKHFQRKLTQILFNSIYNAKKNTCNMYEVLFSGYRNCLTPESIVNILLKLYNRDGFIWSFVHYICEPI